MSNNVSFWLTIGQFLGKILHYFTGFLVHPQRGGCCDPNIFSSENKNNESEK